MDDEVGRARKLIQKDVVRIVASVIPMLLLLWTIQAGIKLAADPGNKTKYNQFAFLIGVVTVTFGSVYFIIGLCIVAGIALDWSSRLPLREDKKTAFHRAWETKTARRDTSRLAATVITMFMLLWAIFTGFRLVTESTRDGKHKGLAFSIGVVAIVFGFVYFIIGLAILADLILDVSDELQKNEKKEPEIHIDGYTDA